MTTVAPKEFDLLADLRRRRKRTVRLPEDRALIAPYAAYPKNLLSTMKKKGLLRSISHGHYLVVGAGGGSLLEEASAYGILDGALAGRRYAISFLSALADYGLVDHEPREITLVLFDRRKGSVLPTIIGGIPVRARFEGRPGRTFGIRTEDTRGGTYRVADPERALIDSLDRADLGGGPETVVRALARGLQNREVRVARLCRYAAEHSARVARRLGYLLELFEAASEEQLVELERVAKKSHRYEPLFGASATDDDQDDLDQQQERSLRWWVTVDVPPQVLIGWRAYEETS